MSGKNLKIDGKVCPNVTVIKALDTDQNKLVEFVDTSDANATSSDIITGKTAYVDGKKVIGEATAGIDTSDATAIAADIRVGKTAYAKDVKLTGTIEDYDGTFVSNAPLWKASVSNLGAQDPNTVVFNTPADSVPKPWSEVEFNGDVFIKFPKMYKKIVTVTDNQITAFEIANKKIDNDYKLYPCFIDESGNELDYILVGKYVSNSTSTCNSITPENGLNQTIKNGRTQAQARGSGYQIMDWRIQRLWQDLAICAYKKIDINSGISITYDKFGIYWDRKNQWIDGICHDGETWIYSNSPLKYIDYPTASSESYAAILGYTMPVASGNNEIKKIGYDSTQPFFNYPSEVVSNSSFNTYYCDGYWYSESKMPIDCNVAFPSPYRGAFYCVGDDSWNKEYTVRLCYRPISS